ncbi:MAG: DUF1080 domain-containing protein [Gemmatimonadota bacterium]|nr:DUF1080 domain-containing protein [Gemmatimonadota bacterium]
MQLFDGETLNGWAATGNPDGWKVDRGCIFCTAERGEYLYYTKDRFRDFELSLEFRHPPGANSGVFFRWTDLDDPVQTGIEIQILDTYGRNPATAKCCGAVYDVQAPTHNACKPPGEWNHMVVCAVENHIQVDLNGERVTEMDLSRWTTPGRNPDGTPNKFNRAYCEMTETGYIGLQDHNSRIWFRNLDVEKR